MKKIRTVYREKGRFRTALKRYVLQIFPCEKHKCYFGCDAVFLKRFLEYQFINGMGWDNFAKKWQIDHVLPLCVFDMKNEHDVFLSWNWINLRPLMVSQNKSRNPYISSLCILEDRLKFFPNNNVIGELVVLAKKLAVEDESPLVDWSLFHV
jgi:hypothetical protein